MSYVDRFHARYIKEPNSGCWLWTGAINKNTGYGVFRSNNQMFLAHRFAYLLSAGALPEDKNVCHACDVRHCVNPDHLFLGTQKDNMADMVKKGRAARGEKISNAKLTDAQVKRIFNDCRPQNAIADDYAVSQPTISRIKARKIWAHVEVA